jgi:hypothetical protein
MDGLLNKGKEMLSGNNSNQGGAAAQEGNPQQGGNAGQEDYGDKGKFLLLFPSLFHSSLSPFQIQQSPRLPSFFLKQPKATSTPLPPLIHSNTPQTGLDFIEKKTGHSFSRDQNEKVTDAARGFYEKQTGYVLLPPLLQALGSDEMMAFEQVTSSPCTSLPPLKPCTLMQTLLRWKPSQLEVLELEY